MSGRLGFFVLLKVSLARLVVLEVCRQVQCDRVRLGIAASQVLENMTVARLHVLALANQIFNRIFVLHLASRAFVPVVLRVVKHFEVQVRAVEFRLAAKVVL